MANPFNVNKSMPIAGNGNMNMFRNMYRAISQSNNPMQMFMNLAGQNPQMQPIVNAMRSGNSPEQIFKNMCQQRGIDPNEFIKNITG